MHLFRSLASLAEQDFKIIGKYVSGNVAAVQTELRIGYIEKSRVDRVIAWNITR